MSGRAPAIFVSHGAPSVLAETGPWQLSLEMIGRETKPRAVVIMSAHWRSRAGFDVGFQDEFETVHDFSGFSESLQQFIYPGKGDQDVAQQCVDLLKGAAFSSALDLSHGLDHGAYVPLHFLWPKGNVPIIPVAISSKARPQDIFRVGEILAPLRNEGVLILGSGGMVHNLGEIATETPTSSIPESWASEFEEWVLKALADRDFSALCDFREYAPHGQKAHPTWEHFAPLIFVAGSASAWNEDFQELYRGWTFGSLSMTSVGFGINYRQ
jgi:4,5-DOPA dioxygenase extradiol